MTIKRPSFWTITGLILSFALISAPAAWAAAEGVIGQPHNWGINFQEPASLVKERMEGFHHGLLILISVISAFVMFLLLWVMIRYNSRTNPVPSKVTHNTMLEVVWTAVPAIILVLMVIPSMQLLYYADRTHDAEMTLTVKGNQWYWSYEYPDHGDISFSSNMIPDKEINKEKGQVRLLSTDNPVVLPVNTNIRLMITATDVLHAFAVPAFGVKLDAVPGRFNETWVNITKEGTFYGQCSELCGTNHGFMPIEIHAVSKEKFAEWVKSQGGKMPEVKADAGAGAANAAETEHKAGEGQAGKKKAGEK